MRLKDEDEQAARMARSDFESLFAAQMTGINRNNGKLRVSLSFATNCQFRSHFAMRFAAAKLMLLCCEVALVCQNHFRNCEIPCGMGLLVRNLGFTTSQGVSQLRNGDSCAAKWHSCAKLTFAAAKILAENPKVLRNDLATKCSFRRSFL